MQYNLLLASLGLVSASLYGNASISTHYYSDQADVLDGHRTSCGVGAEGVDLTRVTAMVNIEGCDCLKCITVSSDIGEVHVVVIDKGGQGLDLAKESFIKLSGGSDTGHVAAKWRPADPELCRGIIPEQGPYSKETLVPEKCKSTHDEVPSEDDEPSRRPNKKPNSEENKGYNDRPNKKPNTRPDRDHYDGPNGRSRGRNNERPYSRPNQIPNERPFGRQNQRPNARPFGRSNERSNEDLDNIFSNEKGTYNSNDLLGRPNKSKKFSPFEDIDSSERNGNREKTPNYSNTGGNGRNFDFDQSLDSISDFKHDLGSSNPKFQDIMDNFKGIDGGSTNSIGDDWQAHLKKFQEIPSSDSRSSKSSDTNYGHDGYDTGYDKQHADSSFGNFAERLSPSTDSKDQSNLGGQFSDSMKSGGIGGMAQNRQSVSDCTENCNRDANSQTESDQMTGSHPTSYHKKTSFEAAMKMEQEINMKS